MIESPIMREYGEIFDSRENGNHNRTTVGPPQLKIVRKR